MLNKKFVGKAEINEKTGFDRKLWEHPWKYYESFIIAIAILAAGIVAELLSHGKAVMIRGIPVNFWIIIIYFGILLAIHLKYRELEIIIWISGVPASVSAITSYSILILLLGFIPQSQEISTGFLYLTGLSHINNSWEFLLIQFYLLTSLGMVVLKRTIPFKIKNIGFIMNHFGLWLTLVAAGLGSADVKRLSFRLFEDNAPTNIAVSDKGIYYKMPFSLKLISFNIEQYNPSLVIVNNETKKNTPVKSDSLTITAKGIIAETENWQIKVLDYKQKALILGGILKESYYSDGTPAAYVKVRNRLNGDTVKGWISSGINGYNATNLNLNKQEMLMLSETEPKKYSSRLLINENPGKIDSVSLEVNKPVSVKGWVLYQSGYNKYRYQKSSLSVVQAVRDPWLPIVYMGMILLFSGSVYLFVKGKN